MPSILDRVAANFRSFRPETTQEFFGLQLARKLKDVTASRHYAELAARFSEDLLLRAYRDALSSHLGEGLAQRFHVELRRLTHEEGYERRAEAGRL